MNSAIEVKKERGKEVTGGPLRGRPVQPKFRLNLHPPLVTSSFLTISRPSSSTTIKSVIRKKGIENSLSREDYKQS
ncbi:MAG: hypothetical protein ACTSUB_03335, partial [Candidatus Thorarchaeota archaeon]